ncbi:hypothetical protein AB4Y89_22115 [Terriglobus sp. 2YAB30_2]|uniref:hypothetical protein n=1 Tax=unclassified Terriglobus TaxID=2628988 RepID=UPI003F9D559B
MGELIKQLDIRGISWRSLFLTGAFPALLCVNCVLGYTKGWQGCTQLIVTLVSFKTEWQSVLRILIAYLLLCALFVALRVPILVLYRRIPLPLIHGWCLRWHVGRRRSANTAKEQALWKISVARWHERAFDANVSMVESVRKKLTLPSEDKLKQVWNLRRTQIAANAHFGSWRRSQLQKALEWLYVLASIRALVAQRAAEIAGRASQSDAANWQQAQDELGMIAPSGWINEELQRWRDLCHSNTAQERIASLNRHELYDNYARVFRRAEQFPSEEWIEATPLGNTMAALEGYSTLRYGIDTSLLWSRVEKVIPAAQRDEIYAAQTAVYALLNSSAALFIAGVAAIAWTVKHLSEVWQSTARHLSLLACFFLLAWIFSKFAVYAAGQLRYQIEAGVDLYTPRLLAALGLVPKDLAERRSMIESLGRFMDGSSVSSFNFVLQPLTDPVLSIEKSK